MWGSSDDGHLAHGGSTCDALPGSNRYSVVPPSRDADGHPLSNPDSLSRVSSHIHPNQDANDQSNFPLCPACQSPTGVPGGN